MILRLLNQLTSLGEATNCLIDETLEKIPDYLVRLITPISLEFVNTLGNLTFIAFKGFDRSSHLKVSFKNRCCLKVQARKNFSDSFKILEERFEILERNIFRFKRTL